MTLMNRAVTAIAFALLPGLSWAHSFGQVYNLPVPFWLYGWGASAALIASFVMVGYFLAMPAPQRKQGSKDLAGTAVAKWVQRLQLLPIAKMLSIVGLLLCIATGLWGTKSPYGNFNMTFFWIVFVLGFTYLIALVGDVYALINPWRLIASGIRRIHRGYGRGLLAYPSWLGHWPALLLYGGFIWLELFGGTTPYSLALWLCAYSLLNFIGIALVGTRDWFRYVEFLSLFLRLIAKMAPLHISEDEEGKVRVAWRMPFAGLQEKPAEDFGVLLFILFMLSSTAFDGLHETAVWQRIFWVDLYHGFLNQWVGSNPLAAFPQMSKLLLLWQSFWLLVSPFLYLLVYVLCLWCMRWVAASQLSLRELALAFAPTLLPIALVYNISHYYTLIQTQGVKIVTLASDPFGRRWDLFGTGDWLQRTIIPDAGTVWHAQVGLIVVGHIVSVYVAHKLALQLFPTQRQAILSQLPMLLLMVLFTVAGLWIMSEPIKTGL